MVGYSRLRLSLENVPASRKEKMITKTRSPNPSPAVSSLHFNLYLVVCKDMFRTFLPFIRVSRPIAPPCMYVIYFWFLGAWGLFVLFRVSFFPFFLNLGGYVVLRRGGGGKIPCDSWIMMRSLSFSFSGSLTLNAISPIRVVYLCQTSCQTVRTNRTHTSHIHVFFQPETALYNPRSWKRKTN